MCGGGGGYSATEKSKCQDLPKFQFSGWGGGYSATEKSKCQDLPKFQFSGWGGGYSATEKSKCQDLPKFQFSGCVCVGGGGILQLKSQSAKICLNFNFLGGGGILYCRIGVNCRIWTKFSTTPAGSCITDKSLTYYVCGD